MQRKIMKVGNTNAVSLPKEVLHHLNAKKGDIINFTLNDNGEVTFKKHGPYQIDGISEGFMKEVDNVISEYDEMLKNLSKR